MSVQSQNDEKLAPITIKIPVGMLEIITEMVKNGPYNSRAELIREAIDDLISWEKE